MARHDSVGIRQSRHAVDPVLAITAFRQAAFSVFNVVLFEPEIPPNTGNVIRLCANTGARLHLIEPLGFPLDHAKMKRAGLDYHEFARVLVHASFDALVAAESPDLERIFVFTTKASQSHDQVAWRPNDWLIFGAETRGLSSEFLNRWPSSQWIRLPMRAVTRSLNLSNAVAIAVFEAWRQNGFLGAAEKS
jgi:tRNA (cytidine/uridine-2'-O-)-methyltransferase